MASKIKGVVANTSAKPWAGRNGTVTLYSFQLDGSKDWYRCGTNKPNFDIGNAIEFEYEVDARGSKTLVPGTAQVTAIAQVTTAPKATGGKENWDARAAYWDAKEKREIEVVEPRISLAAARTAAVAVVGLALQHEALSLGSSSKANKLQIILDAIDEVTARYYEQQMTAGQKPEPVAKAEPGPEDYNDDIPE